MLGPTFSCGLGFGFWFEGLGCRVWGVCGLGIGVPGCRLVSSGSTISMRSIPPTIIAPKYGVNRALIYL